MNNFEKIKNMTLDEMAEMLCYKTLNSCAFCSQNYELLGGYCPPAGKCDIKYVKQWLQQESEG